MYKRTIKFVITMQKNLKKIWYYSIVEYFIISIISTTRCSATIAPNHLHYTIMDTLLSDRLLFFSFMKHNIYQIEE